LLGRIGAVHALGDLHAMGASPHSALAIATIPLAAPHIVQDTLSQLMQGAQATLDEEGVVLIGGHSNEGAELAFGLTVNGFASPGEILPKTGIRAGDALVLTKPLGTGVLLAANMAASAEGRWIEGAIDCMLQSNRAAVPVLRAHGVHACTDVTGFGLAGHLLEMLRDASVGACLDASALPVLSGARCCIGRGWRSSLDADNAAALSALEDSAAVDTATRALLTDPQTAGGLLAAMSPERAGDCVRALQAAGYAQAAIIGHARENVAPARLRILNTAG
jgi:selenide,water dikinase